MTRNFIRYWALPLIFVFVLTQSGRGSIIYVDADATGANTGASWQEAYICLQAAIASASNGDEIRVAQGIYKPDENLVFTNRGGWQVVGSGDRTATFQLKNGVILKGGFAGLGESDTDARDIDLFETILSGDLAGNDVDVPASSYLFMEPTRSENSYHVVTGSGTGSAAVLDGFTVTAGAADTRQGRDRVGSGMHNINGGPTVLDCTFRENLAMEGGGVCNEGNAYPTFTGCVFRRNAAIFQGGGMLISSRSTLTDCVFTENWCAENGGGMSIWEATVVLTDCTFEKNSTEMNGGGIFSNYVCNITLDNCTFTANSSPAEGGGINFSEESIAVVSNCSFVENSAGSGGGLTVYGYGNNDALQVIDSKFIKNSATWRGGGLSGGQGVQVTGCTFIENTSGGGGGATAGWGSIAWTLIYGYAKFVDCTFRGNSADENGGGLESSNCVAINCKFEANRAKNGGGATGGGFMNPTWSDCSFISNSATGSGGGMSCNNTLNMIDCFFSGNDAGGNGGGVGNSGKEAVFERCVFNRNTAGNGGGISNDGNEQATVSNCKFNGNVASEYGGAIYCYRGKTTVINCTAVGNTAKSASVMGQWDEGGEVVFVNCTLTANVAEEWCGALLTYGASPLILSNCILWNNIIKNPPEPYPDQCGSNWTLSHSCIEGEPGQGRNAERNIGSNPMFVRPPNDGGDGWGDNPATAGVDESANDDFGNLWLQPGSPCIDAGDNTALPADTLDFDDDGDTSEPVPFDLDGAQRILGHAIDIGAYEHHEAHIIYVDAKAAGVNDGRSWENAYQYLQDGLAAADAAVKPVEVRVAGGLYRPDQGAQQIAWNREASFHLINWVSVKGGYAGFGAPDLDVRDTGLYETILTGDLLNNDVQTPDVTSLIGDPARADNSYHVVTAIGADYTAVLDGFTIIGGNANDEAPYDRGGGIYLKAGNPEIVNCMIRGNSADKGAGMFNNQSSPKLTDCLFHSNSATFGGGLSNNSSSSKLFDCVFSSNWAQMDGGGIYNDNRSVPELTVCVFMENSANRKGGGINNVNSSPLLKDCILTKNAAGERGGGICNTDSEPTSVACELRSNSAELGGAVYNDQSKPILVNCKFIQNIAHERGGGIFSSFVSAPTVANCTFTQNLAGERGGAIYSHSSSATVNNCTLFGNAAGWDGGGISNADSKLSLANSVLWANNAKAWPQIASLGRTVDVFMSNCNIQGVIPAVMLTGVSSSEGNDNLDIYPHLAADGHLRAESHCIDAGDNDAVTEDVADLDQDGDLIEPIPIDTDGDPRFGEDSAVIVDIGADEFVDTDGDKLPDWWEKKYFDSRTAADPNVDSDGDTLTNLKEYELYGSNPVANPIYVDPLAGSLLTIQEGIDIATNGDTVLVAAGTYTGQGNRDIDYGGKSVILKSLDGPDVTLINCEGLGRGFNFHSGEGPGTAVIGFTISNGQSNLGGAIYCERSNPHFRDCIIAENGDPNDEVGGIYCYLAHPTIADCVIRDNTADGIRIEYGGAHIEGRTTLLSDRWAGHDLILAGDGVLEIDEDSVLLLNHSRIRCDVSGAGTIEVGVNAELIVEADSQIDLASEPDNGRIECHGLLRVREHAVIRNASINVTRVSFEGEVNIFNTVITAEAGAPYGQFFVEDSVTISGNEIHADGDRYMDMDRSIFEGLVQGNRIYVLITEGVGQTRGGLLELRGQDGLVDHTCRLDEFICRIDADTIPASDPKSWTLEELNLVDSAKLNLTNRFDFQEPYDSGGDMEVLYVRNLILGEGAVLNTAFNRIYYENIYTADTSVIENVPLLGFSLNMITLDNDVEFLTRISNNNYNHPANSDYDRTHVRRVTSSDPDPNGMMKMCNFKDLDPDSSQYGQTVSARAKGLFAKTSEDRILIFFEYLFETSEPGVELVVYLSDVPELLAHSDTTRDDHYIEAARIPAPSFGLPGSSGSGRYATFRQYVSGGNLDFIRGTRIELELIGPDKSCILIDNWDPQVHCDGICMDLNWSNAADEEDFMIVISEYGKTAELLADATNSRACLDGVFSTDGFVDFFDVVSWDWALGDPDRIFGLNLCQVPLSNNISTMNLPPRRFRESSKSVSISSLPNPLSDILIAGKRSTSNDPAAMKSKDRFYTLDRNGEFKGWSDPACDRGNIRLVKGPGNEIYQINSFGGLLQLNNTDTSIVPPGQVTYDNDPRYNSSAIVYVGIHNQDLSSFGRPILDAVFDDDYVYVVPVVVNSNGKEPYTAAAKLRLLGAGNPPYMVVQLYYDPPLPNDNRHLDNLREIEIDGAGNIYILNVHSLNESDMLWKFSPDGQVLNRLDLGNPNSNRIHDPIAMHISDTADMVYLTSGQYNESHSAILYGFLVQDLTLERVMSINGVQHITAITEDPATGTLWAVGFNMESIPEFPDPVQAPFYYPCLSKIPLSNDEAEVFTLFGSYDLGLPMSIIWTGEPR